MTNTFGGGLSIMTFSDYANGLYPYLSNGVSESEYFSEMIGHFIKVSAIDACKPLNTKPDTQYRYVVGARKLTPKYAKYIYENRDLSRFEKWIDQKIFESDSVDAVCDWLTNNGQPGIDPQKECTNLLEKILISIANKKAAVTSNKDTNDFDLKLIEEIENRIRSLRAPTQVDVPVQATKEEEPYINELYKAYGDAEKITPFTREDLASYPDYAEDLDERRIDYYAAESIRRGVQELNTPSLANQFDILKDSTYNGVKDTAKKKYSDGYERMLSVMEQSVKIPSENYLLGKSPYWISAKIKKGVCHHLVNDGKIKWVRSENKDN